MQDHSKDTTELNRLLKGERSACETYEQAMQKLSDEPSVHEALKAGHDSHRMRAEKLTSEIQRLGGDPSRDSGAWGSFATLMQKGAKAFGKKAAVSALEEGEDKGKRDYGAATDKVSPTCRQWIETELQPEQMKTHDMLESLQSRL